MKKTFGIIMVSCVLACTFSLIGCKQSGPSLVDLRKEEVRRMDSIALDMTNKELYVADSTLTFKEFELQEMKRKFVLEKDAKYQSSGYYVLPKYVGSKAEFNFFPEVGENGKVVLVFVNKNRKYTPVEVNVRSDDYLSTLPANIPSAARNDAILCCKFARLMYEIEEGKKNCERLNTKVSFYERKIELNQ